MSTKITTTVRCDFCGKHKVEGEQWFKLFLMRDGKGEPASVTVFKAEADELTPGPVHRGYEYLRTTYIDTSDACSKECAVSGVRSFMDCGTLGATCEVGTSSERSA